MASAEGTPGAGACGYACTFDSSYGFAPNIPGLAGSAPVAGLGPPNNEGLAVSSVGLAAVAPKGDAETGLDASGADGGFESSGFFAPNPVNNAEVGAADPSGLGAPNWKGFSLFDFSICSVSKGLPVPKRDCFGAVEVGLTSDYFDPSACEGA